MPARRSKPNHVPNLVEDEWLAMLAKEEDGVRQVDLAKAAGRSRQTIFRGRKGQGKDRTIGAAFAARNALAKAKGKDIPPPAVTIRDELDYEWYILGRTLKDANLNEFRATLGRVRKQVAGVTAWQGLTDLSDPQGSDEDDNDE